MNWVRSVCLTGYIPRIHRQRCLRRWEGTWRRKKPISSKKRASSSTANTAGRRNSQRSFLIAISRTSNTTFLKNKASNRRFLKQCHRITILGSQKNLSVNSFNSLSFFHIQTTSEMERFHGCVLQGTMDAKKNNLYFWDSKSSDLPL